MRVSLLPAYQNGVIVIVFYFSDQVDYYVAVFCL